jgi:hypothetical protein
MERIKTLSVALDQYTLVKTITREFRSYWCPFCLLEADLLNIGKKDLRAHCIKHQVVFYFSHLIQLLTHSPPPDSARSEAMLCPRQALDGLCCVRGSAGRDFLLSLWREDGLAHEKDVRVSVLDGSRRAL